jgi:6-pyruvoyltetrahydropterin/6-carboxytetrahydropterin synthase
MPSITVLARRAYFSCGRVLCRPDWSAEQNAAVFGKEARPHGHDYVLTVFYAGTPSDEDGMIVNLNDLKPVLARAAQPLDGAFLPDGVAYFQTRRPTAGNLVNFLWQNLPPAVGGAPMVRVVLVETSRLSVEKSLNAMKLTRRYEFAAAHRLHAPQLSEAENNARYGKCNNPSGHGHNYGLEVTVEGEPDAETGAIIPLPQLDEIVEREIFARFDHRHLNLDCPEFANLIPTSENLARVIFRILQPQLSTPAYRLVKIGLHETQKNYFEVEA